MERVEDKRCVELRIIVRFEKKICKQTNFFKVLLLFMKRFLYLPPEIVLNKEYGPPVDVWAVGVLNYELLAGNPPFEENTVEESYRRIKQGIYHFPAHFTPLVKDCIKNMLVVNPERRHKPEQIQKHSWIVKFARPHIFKNGKYVGRKNLMNNQFEEEEED